MRRHAHLSRRGHSTSSLNTRSMRFELLEDRRLLAITVNSLVDEFDGSIVDGDISLRDAIAASPAGGEINFSVTGTIGLSLGQLTINKSLTITGPGADLLTIDQNTVDSRVFNIGDGNSGIADKTVALSGLTITGGNVSSFTGGGGILNFENLTLTSCTVSGNSAIGSSDGGGLWSSIGTVTITNSTISGNSANEGGGILIPTGPLTITGSTISGNSAYMGGGIWSQNTSLTINGSTISGNSAASTGGGIYIYSNPFTTITNSLITGNSAATASEISRTGIFGTPNFLNGFNLIGDSSKTTAQALNGATPGASDILATSNGTDPTALAAILAPLADNGGPTRTHALRPGSPAINAGNPLAAPTLLVTPASVVSSTSPDFFPASQLIDNSGLGVLTLGNVATELHAAAGSTNSWVTASAGGDYFPSGGTPPVLTFTLPDRMLLTDIVVWGYAFGPGMFNNNEAKTLEVSFSTDGGANFGAPITLEHARTGVNSETLSLGGAYLANVVRVRITDNHSGNTGPVGDRVGLGEVRFLATNATDQRGAGFPRYVNGRVDIGAYEVQSLDMIVDTLADESDGDYSVGDLSLREAIELANGFVGADTIGFAGALAGGTINIASQLPTITEAVTITGLGANLLTINAGNGTDDLPATLDGFRIFNIDNGSASLIDVAISGLTLTGGDTPGQGGAILNRENLSLTANTVSGNASDGGGGIANSGAGTLTVTSSTISGNRAGNAGGIANFSGGTAVLTESTVSGNQAGAGVSGVGGGIYNRYGGTLTITGSTISGNSAGSGGGIISRLGGGTVTITDSTISGNSAGSGGGFYNRTANATITSSTISGNSVFGYAGAGVFAFGSGTTNIASSVITGNTGGQGSEIFRNVGLGATVNINAFNLIGNSSKTTAQALGNVTAGATDILATSNGTNPTALAAILAPLANNGGPTQTHALVAGSPAINAGSPVVDLAPGGVATQSSEYEFVSLPAGNAIDGNPATFTSTSLEDANATWQVTMPSDSVVTQVVLHNRLQNQSRLRDITVEVLNASGVVVASSTLLNPENILGGGQLDVGPATLSFDLVAEMGGPVVGRTIRVRRTGDPDLSGSGGQGNEGEPNILSLGEVDVLGLADIPGTDQRGTGYERIVNGRIDIGAFEVQAPSADFDGDGDVDGRDFLLWQRGFGTPAPTAVKPNGDADNDLDVDGGDLTVWQDQYGTGSLVAEEGTGDEGQGTEIADRRVGNVSDRSTPGANADGSPYEASYVEEVDRAIEQFATVPSGVRSFGQMVARRGVAKDRVCIEAL